ncbi:MAG: N-acetylmuramoyl-L-alanine amidase [Candidatus Cloacimonetes bacterium]|nr:N-acetylmuramoyl-L-alanine amidase [Candidatus Cloacimonadota bacterium]
MNLIKQFMTKSDCYKQGKTIKVEKLVLHSTGTPQPDADAYIKNENKADANAAVHAFIETDRIIQTLPWTMRGWHVGSGSKGSYNNNAIGVEICEPSGFKYSGGATMVGYNVAAQASYFNKVYDNAVELFTYLCKEFNLTEKDIVCHSEVHTLGYGSGHADVMHWFPKHGKSMDTFRSDVAKKLKTPVKSGTLYRVQTGAFSVKGNADALLKKIKAAGFDAYVTKVGKLYKVQVGAFGVKTNADVMLKKLESKGFDSFITTD